MNRSGPGKGISRGGSSRSDMPAAVGVLKQDKQRALIRGLARGRGAP
jgi:hypothetical protein